MEPGAASEIHRDPVPHRDRSGGREQVVPALRCGRDVADAPRVDRAEMGVVMLLDVGRTPVHGPGSSSAPRRSGPATFLPPSISSTAGNKKGPAGSAGPGGDRAGVQFDTYSRGSVIRPAMALAATVAGEARNTWDSLWPMRPGKLRLVALMHLSPGWFMRPKVSSGPPRHAAQPAFSVMRTPASTRICQRVWLPQRVFWRSPTISGVAGTPKVSMVTLRPCSTRANSTKSLVLPPVQEPM